MQHLINKHLKKIICILLNPIFTLQKKPKKPNEKKYFTLFAYFYYS